MFKLIKILNSGANVPEPCRIPKAEDTIIKAAEAMILTAGYAQSCPDAQKPEYISLACAAVGETEVVCYPVSPDMIFETAISASATALSVGDKVTLSKDTDGASYFVSATTSGGVATITDLSEAKNAGDKVNVKFA